MMKISFQNASGELDSREVEAPCDVQEALIEMIRNIPEFYSGDRFVITDDEE